jgi:hypothetical protein
MQPLEYESAQETFYDFCLWPYPPAAAYEKKFKSVNLLLHSFQVAGMNARGPELVRAIQQGIGPDRTVWGVKRLGGDISWEFYFYDYRRRQRQTAVPRVLEACRPFFGCDVPINENFHYFMFSIDIDQDLANGERDLDEIHLYIGNPGSTVSSGICYSMKKEQTKLENFYFFFEAQRQWDEIVAKLSCSVHYDAVRWAPENILWPELQDCKVIVVANKQANDAVYFSGIQVDQLIFFLKRMKWDPSLVAFVENHRPMLDHLRYDIGFDYRIRGNELQILKSAYYGVF